MARNIGARKSNRFVAPVSGDQWNPIQYSTSLRRMEDRECWWYNRGFCMHGPNCEYHHVKRIMCPNYFVGFCPHGSNCSYHHPKFVRVYPHRRPIKLSPELSLENIDQWIRHQRETVSRAGLNARL